MAKLCDGKLSLLEKCPEELLDSFLHQVVDGMCGHCRPRYQDYGKVWTIDVWYDIITAYEGFIRSCAKRCLNKDEVMEELNSSVANTQLQQSVADCLAVRQTEIRNMLLAETASISQTYMRDFDWKVKLAVSSDKISSVHDPLVDVALDLVAGEENKTLSVEMNSEELKLLIQSLEGANKALLQLKS